MRAEQVLAKLNPKTQSLEGRVDTVGQRQGITPADCAAAMSGIEDGPLLLVQATHADNLSMIHDLYKWWEACAWEIARRNRKVWRIDTDWKRQRYRKLMVFVLHQHISPMRCPRCLGRSEVYLSGEPVEACVACNGSGKYVYAPGKMISLIGVNRKAWHRKWQHIYYELMQYLRRVDDEAMAKIRRKIGT